MSNTQKPTYEELMAMLEKERSNNSKLLKKIEKQETKLEEQDAKMAKQDAELKKKDNYIAKIEEVVGPFMAEALHNTSMIAKQLNKHCFNVDDVLIKDIADQVQFTADLMFKWANLAKSYFFQTPYAATGSDINGNTPAKGTASVEKAKEEQKQVAGSLSNSLLEISKTTKLLEKAMETNAVKDSASELSEAQAAALNIKKIKAKARVTKAKLKSKGRISKPRYPDKTTHAKLNKNSCECGGKLSTIGQIREKLYSNVNTANQLLQDTENLHDATICEKCGHVHIAISDEQNVPVVPNRQISCETCIDLAYANVNGIPLNKMVSALGRIKGFGNDTFYYSMHDIAGIYIEPLFKMIEATAKRAEVIQVDETPFACLGAQGKRKERETDNQSDEKKTNSKNYILALTAPKFAKEQFCLYYYMKNRSKETLKELITDDYLFNTICTDG